MSSNFEDRISQFAISSDIANKNILYIGEDFIGMCTELAKFKPKRLSGISPSEVFFILDTDLASLGTDNRYCFVGNCELVERFDIIICDGAVEEEHDAQKFMSKINEHLNFDGFIVVAIGVVPYLSAVTFGSSAFENRIKLYPSNRLLTEVWFDHFSFRRIGRASSWQNDAMPRFVFHCRPLKTSVLFIVGKGGSGKSFLSSVLNADAIISTDELFSPMRVLGCKIPNAQKLYEDSFKQTQSIWATWEQLKLIPEVKSYFVDVIIRAVRSAGGVKLILIEGYVVESLITEIQFALRDDYRFWVVSQC